MTEKRADWDVYFMNIARQVDGADATLQHGQGRRRPRRLGLRRGGEGGGRGQGLVAGGGPRPGPEGQREREEGDGDDRDEANGAHAP